MDNSDMKAVINSYENYDEDFRLSADNIRKLEYLTAITYMDRYLPNSCSILDVAAGTGAYALHYAGRVMRVTALDITPKYIEILKNKAAAQDLKVESFVNDARDLSMFPDETFDCVFCMGPIYHLTEAEDRKKMMEESVRVLKKDGLFFLAYINKFFVFSNLALGSKQYLQEKWFQRIINDSVIRSEEKDCFWTDAWFTTPSEIEAIAKENHLEKIKHIAQDGVGRLRADDVNAMRRENFEKWAEFHIRTCEEPSILGISNHGLFIGKKSA